MTERLVQEQVRAAINPPVMAKRLWAKLRGFTQYCIAPVNDVLCRLSCFEISHLQNPPRTQNTARRINTRKKTRENPPLPAMRGGA